MTEFSKNQIRKLGDKIRAEMKLTNHLETDTLQELEDYRVSYKKTIAEVFEKLNTIAKRLRPDAINTYRIKRIQSIIGKLERLPDQEFDRMWDIAGCRCILNTELKVNQLLDKLKDEFKVKKINNYYVKTVDSGYRSIHAYVSLSEMDKYVVEIQIRTKENHYWATLVEIIDLLYNERIKEGYIDNIFYKFHQLMSKMKELNEDEQKQLMTIIHDQKIFKRLLSVFAKNYLRVRIKWLQLDRDKEDHFYVISVGKDQTPEIFNFRKFGDAEHHYFQNVDDPNLNTVMTYLPQTNFDNIETAYSNYTLSTHTFINDYFRIIETEIVKKLEKRNYHGYYKLSCHYLSNIKFYIDRIREELRTLDDFSSEKKENEQKVKYWKKDLNKRVKKRDIMFKEFQKNMRLHVPWFGLQRLIFRFYNFILRMKFSD